MKSKSGILITFLPSGKVVPASQKDETLLQVALRHSFPLDATCGGYGTCGTCRVLVQKGLELLEPRNEIEAELASERGFYKNERLACQCAPVDGLVLEIPSDFTA